jgi:hypothetical protein
MTTKTKQQVHHLELYQDDFTSDSIWRAVCDSLGIDADDGDKVTVYWDINPDIDYYGDGDLD